MLGLQIGSRTHTHTHTHTHTLLTHTRARSHTHTRTRTCIFTYVLCFSVCFQVFDSDGDGLLNEVELVQALGHLCVIKEENLPAIDESLNSNTHASSLAQDVLQQYGSAEVHTVHLYMHARYIYRCQKVVISLGKTLAVLSL